MIKLSRLAVGMFALAVAMAHPAKAEENYPTRPIRVVIGFPAGGGTDTLLREMANKLSEKLKVAVVVENMTGANGNIANESVSRAKADGYTLLYNTSSITVNPYLYTDLKYDFRKDLKPVVMTLNMPLVLVTNSSITAKTPVEFAEYLRSNSGKLNYGSAGRGNITHLAAIQLLEAVGAQAEHVPYRGEAPAVADLLGNHVQFYLGTSTAMIPLVQSGRVNGIAVTSQGRIDGIENLPTLAETILPSTEFGAWSGFMAPAGTPDAIVNKLNVAINEVLKDPAVQARVKSTGSEIRGSTAQEYADYLQSEHERWGKVVKAGNIQPE